MMAIPIDMLGSMVKDNAEAEEAGEVVRGEGICKLSVEESHIILDLLTPTCKSTCFG